MVENITGPMALPDLDCVVCRSYIVGFRMTHAKRKWAEILGPDSAADAPGWKITTLLDALMDCLVNIGECAEAHIGRAHGPAGGRLSWDFLLGEVVYSPEVAETTKRLRVNERLAARRS